jgi:hypothetical protein
MLIMQGLFLHLFLHLHYKIFYIIRMTLSGNADDYIWYIFMSLSLPVLIQWNTVLENVGHV